jgi:flavin-dependent dehydrogenase
MSLSSVEHTHTEPDLVHDVLVVGGRCAGAATATLLARAGHDVVIVERDQFPSDTLSTHSIARSGVVQLARWGLLDEVLAAGTPQTRCTVFHVGDDCVAHTVKPRAGVDMVVAPRRHVLDTIVAEAAVAAGADLRTGAQVRDVQRDASGRVSGVVGDHAGDPFVLRARIVVGADGLRSRVARSVGAAVLRQVPSAAATHYAYYAGGDWGPTEFYVRDRALSGIFPTNDDEACIWVCLPADVAEAQRRGHAQLAEAFDAMLAVASPQLTARLARAQRTSTVHGVMRLPNQVRAACGPGWALVGDAGYHRDPITGHGISDAYRDAELLAVTIDEALRGGDEQTALERYATHRDAASEPVFDITSRMCQFPPLHEFVDLQKQLAHAIDAEACALAALPALSPPMAA